MASPRPKILVSNDDGIEAPGLQQLVKALSDADFVDIYVSAPDGERSAQSSKITLGRGLTVRPWSVPGASLAYASDGSPADSAMIALNSNLFRGLEFDLIVTGINRGDNCGMHVVYSGTVGAAREGAMLGIPSIALSLDNYRGPPDYSVASSLSVCLVRALLSSPESLSCLRGSVLNVNFPLRSMEDTKGFFLTFQGLSTLLIHWSQVQDSVVDTATAQEMEKREVDMYQGGGQVGLNGDSVRASQEEDGGDAAAAPMVFRKKFGHLLFDETPGSDAWAMHHGWVSVTLVSLQQDIVGAHRTAYEACASARPRPESAQGTPPSAPPLPAVFASSSLPAPLESVKDPATAAKTRFGDERLPAATAVVEAAAKAAGKRWESWIRFRNERDSRAAVDRVVG